MSGLAGVILRSENNLGEVLVGMLEAMQHRGRDSAGVAVYRDVGSGYKVCMLLNEESDQEQISQIVSGTRGLAETASAILGNHRYVRIKAVSRGLAQEFARKIHNERVACVLSVGQQLEIMKHAGTVAQLGGMFHVPRLMGHHGIGHVGLLTDPRATTSQSGPFRSLETEDVAIALDGKITNYHTLRRWLLRRGYVLTTDDDAELVAQLIAYYMAQGGELLEALKACLYQLDGAFSVLVSGLNQVAVVRDYLGTRPLLICETPDTVAVASELASIQAAVGDGPAVAELPPGGIQTWHL